MLTYSRDRVPSDLGVWVQQLQPRGDVGDPQVDPGLVDVAVAATCGGAVRWGLQVAAANAARIVRDVPALGGGPAQLAVVRRGTELSTLSTLMGIAGARMDERSLEDERSVIVDLVRRRVPVDVVWQGNRRSHDLLLSALFDMCEQLAHETRLGAEIRHVGTTALEVFSGLAHRSGEHYAQESARWHSSELAVRDEIVRLLLAGGDAEGLEELSRQLSYTVFGREHLGVMLWREPNSTATAHSLARVANAWLTQCGAQQVLVVPQGRSLVWAWGSRRGRWESHRSGDDALPEGVRLTFGSVGSGLTGFRRSHDDARRALELASSHRSLDGPVLGYRDVELLGLLLEAPDLSERFAVEELGPLASRDGRTAELRRTVRLYLESRSPQHVAQQLHVARNTVGYRLRQAEGLRGRPLNERATALACALDIWQALEGDE